MASTRQPRTSCACMASFYDRDYTEFEKANFVQVSSAHRRGPCTRSVTATFAHQFSSRLEHETACPATTDARRRWGTAGNQE